MCGNAQRDGRPSRTTEYTDAKLMSQYAKLLSSWQQGSVRTSLHGRLKLDDPENPTYLPHRRSYSEFSGQIAKFSLPRQQGSVDGKFE